MDRQRCARRREYAERLNLGPFVIGERLSRALEVDERRLDGLDFLELLVPAPLKLGSDQSASRVDLVVLLRRAPRFVLDLLELARERLSASVILALQLTDCLEARLDPSGEIAASNSSEKRRSTPRPPKRRQ